MREILFRGFAPDENGTEKVFVNGEWIKGKWVEGEGINAQYDTYGEKHVYIGVLKKSEIFPLMQTIISFEVIPETVGQYTGLPDKNGKKIFEGDICSSCGMIYQIVWFDDKYGWFCKVLKSNSCLIDTTMAFPLYQYDNRPENGYRQLETIGNIHSNPELLEGEAE